MLVGTSLGPVLDYWLDAWQRSVLSLDVLRERGNIYLEHSGRPAPHVLGFKPELVRDGRLLPRPVNYALVRIVAPGGDEPIRRSGHSSSSIPALATARASAG